MKRGHAISILVIFLLLTYHLNTALGWHNETHLAVGKAAGYRDWYNCTGADMTKIKAGDTERRNHYFNNNSDVEVTPEMVLEQAKRYDDPKDEEGHLYGAIIASLREYETTLKTSKYAEYHLAFCAHYVGDLSQPFHNISYNIFNKLRHVSNDSIVEAEVLGNIAGIERNMYRIVLRPQHFEHDLCREIARIANISRHLGHRLKKEDRDMTKEEAYIQLGHSASLVRAILQHLGKLPNSGGARLPL